MHKTLTIETNRILIACWTVALVALGIVGWNRSVLPCVVGFSFGIWAGILQRRALRAEAIRFAQTVTALDVRRVLVSSSDGKFAIRLGWACAAALVSIAVVQRAGGTAPTAGFAMIGSFAGYTAFMLSRDLTAYAALRVVAGAANSASTSTSDR